jgi:hypothetical protein
VTSQLGLYLIITVTPYNAAIHNIGKVKAEVYYNGLNGKDSSGWLLLRFKCKNDFILMSE